MNKVRSFITRFQLTLGEPEVQSHVGTSPASRIGDCGSPGHKVQHPPLHWKVWSCGCHCPMRGQCCCLSVSASSTDLISPIWHTRKPQTSSSDNSGSKEIPWTKCGTRCCLPGHYYRRLLTPGSTVRLEKLRPQGNDGDPPFDRSLWINLLSGRSND
jgi:hypothetical protein